MERNLAPGMLPGNSSYGGFDLQGPMRVHHSQQHPLALHQPQHTLRAGSSSLVHPPVHESFPPLIIGSSQDYGNKMEMVKSPSDEDDHEDANAGKGKKASQWHRVKWSDDMVRLLITAVSYISEETANEYGGGVRRKFVHLQKKGKWKSISKVMAERGHFVSSQQCEDKFNDLNKRYKRLNDLCGKGTTCQVVEKPSLLDDLDIPEKSKEEARKILTSKHLHYEEMCSYHNGNRLYLPPDMELQRLLRLALRSKDEHDDNDVKRHPHDDNDELEHEADYDDRVECEEHLGICAKRAKQCLRPEEFSFRNSVNPVDSNKSLGFQVENAEADPRRLPSEGMKTNMSQKQWIEYRNLQIEEQRLHIQEQMLELEKERLKWQRFCRKKDQELEAAKMEIEKMRLENERMALELKRKEMGFDHN